MTIMTPQTARKEIFILVDAAWQAKAPAIVGGPAPEIRYQGEEEGAPASSTSFFMRASTSLADTRQSGFAVAEHTSKGQRFTTDGVVILQVFAPMKGPGSYAKGELLASLGQCMFMAASTPSGVWFRRPRINELGNDGTWYRWNVIADIQFDQAKGA